MGSSSKVLINNAKFDPVIELLPADLSIKSTKLHYNIAF